MSKNREELWDDFQSLKYDIQRLSGIVQNEHEISVDEMSEWIGDVEEMQNKLNQMILDMVDYYFDQPKVTDENKHKEVFADRQGKELF